MQAAFGLDISDAWIRLALLEKRGSRLHMPIRGEIPTQPGFIVDGEIQNPQQVANLLRELLRAAGIRNRQAYVALPERHTFTKVIEIPKDHQAELAQAVKDEAVHHLPYAWDEVYFDWSIFPSDDKDGLIQAVIGAAPKTLVDTYLTVLDNSDIEPLSLEIESMAIARSIFTEKERGARMLLDLGRTRSTLALIVDANVLFSATVRYAGKELNKYIADELKISEEQAERAKRIFGLDPNRGKGLLRSVLSPQLDELVRKVHEVEAFYQEHFTNSLPIQNIALTGSGALLRGIDQELGERLGKPVVTKPSWIAEQLSENTQDFDPEIGYTYATALGLSMLNYTAST